MQKLKACVIGIGNMGINHLRILSEIKDVQLIAICDANKAALESQPYKKYTDYKNLIEKENPDLISICVPTSLHYRIAKYCLEKGINTLLEKPIAATVEEAEKLFKIAKKSKTNFLVGHTERFNPAVKKVKEMIEKGELGKIIAMTFRRVGGFPPQIKDCDIAIDLAIHDIDISNYLLEEIPIEVSLNSQKSHIKNRSDSVEFFLKYKNTSSYIQTNWITPVKVRKLTITGSEGYLEMDFINQNIEFYKNNYEKFRENSKNYSDYILKFSKSEKVTIEVAKKEPLKEEILYFLQCIQNDIIINSDFAVDALKIALNKLQWPRLKGSLSQEPVVLQQAILLNR